MSRNRQTGTEITIEPSENIDGGWMTICEAHGDVCDFESKRQARSFAASPMDWCAGCYATVTGCGDCEPGRVHAGVSVAP